MNTMTKHPADEKADLIHDIRSRLPFVRRGHPDLADEIERAMDVLETTEPAVPTLATSMAETAAYLWGLVLSFHSESHGARVQVCRHWFCDPIRYAVIKDRNALIAAGYPDPMVENFKPEHRP